MNQHRPMKSKYIMLVIVIICLSLIILSVVKKNQNNPIYRVSGYVITPLEKVVSFTGNKLSGVFSVFSDKKKIMDENSRLKQENEELKGKVSELSIQNSDIKKYEDLYKTDTAYPNYTKIAANVVSKDTGNWFSTFIIDRGTNDGVNIDNNIIAYNSLIGKVIAVGKNWARVRSIIDSSSHVSAVNVTTGDSGIVSGDIDLAGKKQIKLEEYYDSDLNTQIGDMIVTSNISDVYWPQLLIGYLSEITTDSNNLTKTGIITLSGDFEHLDKVLVITDNKEEAKSAQ